MAGGAAPGGRGGRAAAPGGPPQAGQAPVLQRALQAGHDGRPRREGQGGEGATALIILALVDPLPRRRRDGPGLLPRALLAAGPLCQQLGQRGGAVHGQDQRLGRAEEAEQAVQAGKDEEDEVVRVLGW